MREEAEREMVRLAVEGDFDAAHLAGFQRECERHFDGGARRYLVHLAGVKFVDSTALGYLITFINRVRSFGGELVVSSPSEFFRQNIALLGLERLVRMHPDDASARAALDRAD